MSSGVFSTLGGLRRVLDQLNQFVFKDDTPRCNCEVTPHFKCGFVDPA